MAGVLLNKLELTMNRFFKSQYKQLQFQFVNRLVGVVLIATALIALSLQYQLPRVSSQSTTLIERISVDSAGTQTNGASSKNSISSDGTYVVFTSSASNLVDGDTNGFKDIFIRDRNTGTTTRVSVDSAGAQSNGDSDAPTISSDGRYVAFESSASNLVTGDTNTVSDIFVRDRTLGTTTRISVKTGGTQSDDHSFQPAISSDGRYVAFHSAATNIVTGDTNNVTDIFVHDRTLATTTRVSVATGGAEGNNYSLHPAISGDGRYIAYSSVASNLVSGDTNAVSDVFLHDRVLATTIRISVASAGTEGDAMSVHPGMSRDGRYIGFESDATNLVALDTNAKRDIFVHDRELQVTTRVSVASDGTQSNNNSGDSVDTQNIKISLDGQYVVFKSQASNLVTGDTNGVIDVFVHDRQTVITKRVSVASTGDQANNVSYYPAITDSGQYISFYSYASNLVSGDTNGYGDVFVYNRDAVAPTPTPTLSPTPTLTPTPTPNPVVISLAQNTSSPSEASVSTPGGTVTIRCEAVTQAGSLSILTLTAPPGQAVSYITMLKTNFDVTSSNLVCTTLTLCLPYSTGEVSTAKLTATNLRMLHYVSGEWRDETSSVDIAAGQVCGRPTTFSPFAVGQVTGATPTPTLAVTAAPTLTPTPSILPKSGSVGITISFVFVALLMLGAGVILVR